MPAVVVTKATSTPLMVWVVGTTTEPSTVTDTKGEPLKLSGSIVDTVMPGVAAAVISKLNDR